MVAGVGSWWWTYCVSMARISFPERGLGEHVDWALMRPAMAKGMGALSEAVYGNTQLSVRERSGAVDHRPHQRLCCLPGHPGPRGGGRRG